MTSAVGATLDLTGGTGINLDESFSLPEDGTITSVSAFFSATSALSLVGSTVTVTAQLYQSTTPDNTFTAIPGAVVTLAPCSRALSRLGLSATASRPA